MKIINEVVELVEKRFELQPGAILSHNRSPTRVKARKIAHYVSRCLTHLSYFELSEYFNRDHTSIVHNIKLVEKEAGENLTIAEDIIHTLRMRALDSDLRSIKGPGRGDHTRTYATLA